MNDKYDSPGSPELLEIDMSRTKHPDQKHVFCWDGDVLNYVGQRVYLMDKAMSKMSPTLKASFQEHILSFANQGDYANNSYVSYFASLQTALNLDPAISFDITWIAKALENTSFRRTKRGIFNFFLHWQERNSGAISQDALRLLNDADPFPQTSSNVLSDDPEKSWLFDEEYDALLKMIWSHYDSAASCTQVTLIKLLSMQYARRPIQIAHLKVGDVGAYDDLNKQELASRMINFPGVKDLAAESGFRDSKFEPHPLSDHLWNLCCIQRQEIRTLYEHTLKITLTENQLNKLPLFCSKMRIHGARQIIENHNHLKIIEHLESQDFHLPKFAISKILCWRSNSPTCDHDDENHRRLALPKKPISPRTGETMVVTATRIRHTRVRQLARQGVHKHILSQWLGHTSLNAIDAYYNDPAEQARKIDQLMAPMLAPLAMAFTGALIDSEDQATRANDQTSKLEFANEGELKSVGRCGKHSFCTTTSVPIPCYRCKHFEPLVDAPHHEVLKALTERQSAENEALKLGTLRNLLVPIDLSADIRAVTNCIARCNARIAERGNC